MIRAVWVFPVLVVLGCKTTVESSKAAKDIEVLYQQDLGGEKARHCTKLETYEVVTTSKEVSDTRQSPAVIKARNQATKFDATHVLIWPATSFACNGKGEEVEGADDTCERTPVDAFRCVIGRKTF